MIVTVIDYLSSILYYLSCKLGGMKNFITVMIVLVLMVSCNSSGDKVDKNNYEKTKENLADKERTNPLSFLSVSGNDKRNIIGQTVTKGFIENSATVCSYKNVRVKSLFYKAGSLVENHEDVYDDVVKPGNKMNFKSKYHTPKGTDSVSLSIMSAEVVEE